MFKNKFNNIKMTTIPGINRTLTNSRSANSYGLLTNEATAVMQRENPVPVGDIMVVGRKGVFNIRMLYDWWMIYASRKSLIKDKQWIVPDGTLDALLADEYIKDGATAGVPFRIQTYLAMLGRHLSHDYNLKLNSQQTGYLRQQETVLREQRKQHKIIK